MSASNHDQEPKTPGDRPVASSDAPEATRREALLRMSGYAAAVAPAMLVLMRGRAEAQAGGNGNGNGNAFGNGNGGGNAGGNGNGNGGGNGNGPPCDSPAWNLGLSNAGHSGC
jgi:hypothetical protein